MEEGNWREVKVEECVCTGVRVLDTSYSHPRTKV